MPEVLGSSVEPPQSKRLPVLDEVLELSADQNEDDVPGDWPEGTGRYSGA